MSCAYRSHRYRASVTAHPTSVSWQHPTGHAQHPISLRPLVVHPHRQVVTETANDAPIPVSLVQYLWAQWHQAPPEDRESVARLVANLMRSPRWHWDVTVLPDPSLPDPQHPFVFERAGRPTIGMPITMLRTIWEQVLEDLVLAQYIPTMPPIMQRFVSITDRSLWQEFWQAFCARRNRVRPSTQRDLQRDLYGYLSPRRLPQMTHEIRRLLRSNEPDDRYTALTVLTRWLESPDHKTRTVAARMLHGWPHIVAALVRSYSPDMSMPIHDVLDRLVPTILTFTGSDDRAAWVATLWELVTDPILNERRRQMIADALKRMLIHDPMAAALVRARLRTVPLTHPAFSAPVWTILLEGLMHSAVAGEVLEEILDAIAQAIRQDPSTIARFRSIVATGWGHGYDHRILQFITSHPSPWWEAVLARGITTSSMGAEVCAIIQSQVSRDQAMALIVDHIRVREERGDWPLAPLPAYLIPWVGDAARTCPYYLYPPTVRRLWLADPDHAWNVTQTMFRSGHPRAQQSATAAMDAGWGTGYDAEVATILRARILERQYDRDSIEVGIATAVAGLGIAPPSVIEALLTELAMQGNENVQQQLISALHRGWGRGQDALVLRIVEMIAERDPSEWVWDNARATLEQAWRALPPDVVVSLIDRLVTREMDRWLPHPIHRWKIKVDDVIAALAPIWTALPPSQGIAFIARHVDHLHTYAHALKHAIRRDELIAAWASVIAAGADRLSAADLHALLAPLRDISPYGYFNGVERWVRR